MAKTADETDHGMSRLDYLVTNDYVRLNTHHKQLMDALKLIARNALYAAAPPCPTAQADASASVWPKPRTFNWRLLRSHVALVTEVWSDAACLVPRDERAQAAHAHLRTHSVDHGRLRLLRHSQRAHIHPALASANRRAAGPQTEVAVLRIDEHRLGVEAVRIVA